MDASRLKAEVARLAGPCWREGMPVAVAVSGGADSLALMWLAAQAFGAAAHVLTFDHQLRPESEDEARMVARLAKDIGLGHAVLAPEQPIGPANIQAAARNARLAAMEVWCARHGVPLLMTAHHADDQAETFLMRLRRGSGIDGLSGIRAARTLESGVLLIRPLLGQRKADLEDIVEKAGWTAVQDPSNNDPRFDRTWARRFLAAGAAPDALSVAASAHHLAEAGDALGWAANEAFRSRVRATADGLSIQHEALPAEILRRLVVIALSHVGGRVPRGDSVTRALHHLRDGQQAMLGDHILKPVDGLWLISPAPPRTATTGT